MTSPGHSRTGSAIVIVLSLLAVMLVLLLSLLLTVSSENQQASATLERQRAESLARIAINEVAGKLQTIPLDKHWAASPGRIRFWRGGDWSGVIDLHSGNDGNPDEVDEQVNLNATLADGSAFIIPANAEYPHAPEMKLDWRYVLADGQVIPATRLLPDHQPVGRFAYWVDVENGRVNLNTAGLAMTAFNYHLADASLLALVDGGMAQSMPRYQAQVIDPNPWMRDRVAITPQGPVFSELDLADVHRYTPQNLTGHPSSVDLSFLEAISKEQGLNTFRYSGSHFLRADAAASLCIKPDGSLSFDAPGDEPPDRSVRRFNTPEDWKLIVGEALFQRNKAYVTTLGRTPEITPWGNPKMALSWAANDGPALVDTAQELWLTTGRAGRVTEVKTTEPHRVQLPAMLPRSKQATGAQRGSFRDFSAIYHYSTPYGSLNQLQDALEKLFSAPVPGYPQTLWDKYNATPGGGGQLAVELIGYLDQALNGLSPGNAAVALSNYFDPAAAEVTPGGNNAISIAAQEIFRRPGLVLSPDGTALRSPTQGPFLLNEIALQAEPVAFSPSRYNPLIRFDQGVIQPEGSVAALIPAAQALLDGLPAPPLAGPQAIRTTSNPNYSRDGAHVILFQTKAPKLGDVFIRFNVRLEGRSGPRYGLARPYVGQFGSSWISFISDCSIQWVSDDPQAPSGELKLGQGDASWPVVQGLGGWQMVTHWVIGSGDPSEAMPSAQREHVEMPQSAYQAILLGPFDPGTTLAQVRIRLRTGARYSLHSDQRAHFVFPGGGAHHAYRGGDGHPGHMVNAPGYIDSIQEELLEFNFEAIDTLSGLPRYASLEAVDPRMVRTKADWKPLRADHHTLGTGNDAYLASVASGADPSDFARPPSFLQVLRGRVRGNVLGGGDVRGNIERQNATLILGLPGVGYLSSLPTGVASGTPWQTAQFHQSNDATPDWLMWNFFYVPSNRSISNQTDGKVNLNARLHPFSLTRTKPLAALIGERTPSAHTLAAAIANGPTAAPGLPSDLFVYSGQLCDIPGVADFEGNEYEREALPRDLADLVTMQCDDYRVFVIAESIQRSRSGEIVPRATYRAEVVVSRTPDAGPNRYAFAEGDDVTFREFPVYLRSNYELDGLNARKTDVSGGVITGGVRSVMGADYAPNTADDWLIPQRIDITSYRSIP